MINNMYNLPSIEEINPSRARVLVRVDFNVPLQVLEDSIQILDKSRIESHAETIRRLVDGDNSIVLVSHQGRPGTSDFTSLEYHAEAASEIFGLDVKWVDDVAGPCARDAIRRLGPGEVLLLDNVRLYSEETIEAPPEVHARSLLVRRLRGLFDLYVNDAFATAHRSHASIVGFPYVLPSAIGSLMRRELEAVSRIFRPEDAPKIFVLGGSKVYDTLRIVENLYKNRVAERILTGGLLAEVLLLAKGVNIGQENLDFLERRGLLSLVPRARRLLLRGAPIETPIDFVTSSSNGITEVPAYRVEGRIMDIGGNTISMYTELMKEARFIVLRGPMGVIEDERFRKGTLGVIKGSINSGAFTLFGGGHMNVLLYQLGLAEKAGHVSTGGAALLTLLSGEPLPAVEALRLSYERFSGGG